jgi:aquaporin Z
MFRKAVVEAIGTFFLVFTIGQMVIGTDPATLALAPLAIGAVLTAVVYAGGHISGAHYNPAVTAAIWIRGKATTGEILPYWAAQLAGATLAAYLVGYLKSGVEVAAATPDVLPALLVEFLFTFALCFVILNVATARGTEGNSNYGIAIGFIVMAGAFAVGGISGAVFNPAVALGATILGLSDAGDIWIFLAANFLAGICAGLVFRALDLGSDKELHLPQGGRGAVAAAAATGGEREV